MGESPYSVGVEEEFHVVDAETGELRPVASDVLEAVADDLEGTVDPELHRSQVETGTAPMETLAEVRAELVRLRAELGRAADAVGSRLAASGTHPSAYRPAEAITATQRYQAIGDRFGPVARQQSVCGCHVHIGVPDRELAVQVLNRVRPDLPLLLAISANSPFWQGEDTGYASYRGCTGAQRRGARRRHALLRRPAVGPLRDP